MRTLIAGDSHEPACHDGYLNFLCEVYNEFNCNTVVHVGDIVDNHGPSRHNKTNAAPVGDSEYDIVLDKIALWHGTFPEMKICIGNHDQRPFKLSEDAGIPAAWLKDYNQLWDTPNWEWDFDHTVDGVKYFHGQGVYGRKSPALDAAIMHGCSCVIGHHHHVGGVMFHNLVGRTIFGLSVGCGCDDSLSQFNYNRYNPKRSVLGCGVVIDGVRPYFIPMPTRYMNRK